MFFRHLDNDIKLSISISQYADELFELADKNREFLKQWLPWLDTATKPSDTKAFIETQLLRFQQGKALHVTIFHGDKISGVLGYDRIDQENGIGHMGYWLAKEYNGKGIMTEVSHKSIKPPCALVPPQENLRWI